MTGRRRKLLEKLDQLDDSVLFDKPQLDPGEAVVWEAKVNRTQGRWARGGKLVLTDRRLIFEPHKFERRIGAQRWSCSLADVVALGAKERGLHPISGALRRRLSVRTPTSEELFVIDPALALSILGPAVARAKGEQ